MPLKDMAKKAGNVGNMARDISRTTRDVSRTVTDVSRAKNDISRTVGGSTNVKNSRDKKSNTKFEPQQDVGWTCSCGVISRSKFCGECGKPRPECPKCGVVTLAKFCEECGTKLEFNIT
jgi:membrane protease subunit (stomatin/prohibitin family)